MLGKEELATQKVAEFLNNHSGQLSLHSEIFADNITNRSVRSQKPVPLYQIYIVGERFPLSDFKELMSTNSFKAEELPLPTGWLPSEVNMDTGYITKSSAEEFLRLVVEKTRNYAGDLP